MWTRKIAWRPMLQSDKLRHLTDADADACAISLWSRSDRTVSDCKGYVLHWHHGINASHALHAVSKNHISTWGSGLPSVEDASLQRKFFFSQFSVYVFSFCFLYSVSKTSIFNCNLKTNYHILIIFGKNIPDTTCHQMTIQFSTSRNVCFCTTWGKHNQRNITFLSNAIWLLN